MKKLFAVFFALAVTFSSYAQTTFTLDVVAEGNFGSPNGDVFRRNTTTTPATTSAGLYQTTNATTGFDVLQDFVVLNNKALIAEKPAGAGRIVIAEYPSLNEIHTFSTTNAPQTLVFASSTKAYVSMGNPGDIQCIDLANNTLTSVSDPTQAISSHSDHLLYANGLVYAVLGAKVVKIDTATQAVVGTINPSIGNLKGLVLNTVDNKLWVMNGSGMFQLIDILNNDLLGAIISTGVSSTRLLRIYQQQLYFWSTNKKMYIYNIVNPSALPLAATYTSTLPGASFAFGYGRSFDIDTASGDFVICSANYFSAPGHYEVVDGDAFTVIEAGSIAGCAIPNNCKLKTYEPVMPPVPDVANLPVIEAACSVQLTPPTADGGTLTATTADPINYSTQGQFTVTWVYNNGTVTATQNQTVIINDTLGPVPTVEKLDTLTVECNTEITFRPTANDNCSGAIVGQTGSMLSYAVAGTYTLEWEYADANGNSTLQEQIVEVACVSTGISAVEKSQFTVYPNPANTAVNISTENAHLVSGKLIAASGQLLEVFKIESTAVNTVELESYSNGIYLLILEDTKGNTYFEKLMIR